MNAFSCRAIQCAHRSFCISEHRHAAAAAGAGRLFPSWLLRRECLAVVVRLCYPNLPSCFAFYTARSLSMPPDVYIARRIGRNRSTAVQLKRASHDIALRFECCTSFVKSAVEHTHFVLSRFWIKRSSRVGLGSVPGDMNAVIPSYGDLASSDRPRGNRRTGLVVDPQWRRPRCARVRGSHIEKVTVHRIAQVVKQM